MIQISLTAALVIYSAVIVAGALGMWLYMEITTRRAYLILEKQYLWRCVFCSYTYLDAEAVKHSKCPQCQAINSMDDPRARFVRQPGGQREETAAEARQETRHNPSKGKKKGARHRGPRRRSR